VRPGSVYFNAGHTDYDLPAHVGWVAWHRLRAIYLIHDLIPILHPDHCRPHAVRRHTGRVASALRHGAGIVVGSDAVARDLAAHARAARLPCPPVVVAPLAGADLARAAPAPAAGADDYFVCVGTIESRKNHALLLAVWDRLRAEHRHPPRLVIAGRWGTGADGVRAALAASGMAGGLIDIVEDCDDAALAALMQGARAMLMPSLAEGFGLPMAEALACGVPVIASDLPCFREVGQGIPCLLDPHDVAGWTVRIAGFDRAAAQRQRRIDALRGYRPPRWDAHFAQVDTWLTTLTRPAAPADAAQPGPGRVPRAGRRLDLGTAR
jgi:glycosyltransferase involved in cell wall biosynthesis